MVNFYKIDPRPAYRIILFYPAQYLFTAVFLVLIFSSHLQSQNISYGDSAIMAGGKVQTWIETDASNNPVRLGFTMSKTVIANVSSAYSEVSLNFPDSANDSLFKHVLINWNPSGHPPNNVYGPPHFDIHYYIITNNERLLIRGGTDKVVVPAMYMPQDYSFIPPEEYISVPEMGVHYVDTKSPELNGQPFTRTFLYGFSKGKLIFLEPMITKDYFTTIIKEVIPLKLPQSYEKAGFYPTSYEVNYDSTTQNIDIILRDLAYHDAVTNAEDEIAKPDNFELLPNYPNPFNPSTVIQYRLPQTEFVSMKIYDALGNEIQTLISETKPAGVYRHVWNAAGLSAGVYFCRLKAGNFIQTQKILFLK